MVVFSNKAPYIAIEIKSDEKLFNTKNSEDLLFNPYVRQVQAYATFLKAPYYLLTNGLSFFWFTTDDAGRPKLLASPVLSPDHSDLSDHDIVRLLQNLRDFFFINGVSFPRDEAAIVIYAKLLYEYGDPLLEERLINSNGEYNLLTRSEQINIPLQEILRDLYFARNSLYDEDERKRTYYARAFEIVNRIAFRDVTPQVLLSALDKVFIGEPIRHEGPRIPRWLADFLVRLSEIRKEDIVLDIYSPYGDIAAAVLLASERELHPFNNVIGISPNATAALWAQIQQIIVNKGSRINNILIGNTPPYDKWNVEYESSFAQQNPRPTRIIAAPPFGAKFDTRETQRYGEFNGLKLSEDLYLDLAMSWVQKGGYVTAIVPEGLLVSGNRKNIRALILSQMHIRAIISLGTFLSHTTIKSSILVLDKKRSLESSETFFYHIGEVTNTDTFDSRSIPQVAQALTTFEQWSAKQQSDTTPNSMIVPLNLLDRDNLSFPHYVKTSAVADDIISQYATARLGDLTIQIQRGCNGYL